MNKALEALCYLDDIAHGRKMNLDPHELKLIIEKELKALEILNERCDLLSFISVNRMIFYKEEYELLKEVLL